MYQHQPRRNFYATAQPVPLSSMSGPKAFTSYAAPPPAAAATAAKASRAGGISRWALPVIAVSAVALGAASYVRSQQMSVGRIQRGVDPVAEKYGALMDAYGDRDSLEALEKAMESYRKE